MGKKWFMFLVLITVLGVAIYAAAASSQLYIYEAGSSGSYTYNLLLNSGIWLMLVAAGLGIIFGAALARTTGIEKPSQRQGAEAFFNEWDMSFCILGSLILMVTGFMVGGIWSPRLVTPGATGFALNLHFMGIVILLFGSIAVLTRAIFSGDYSRFSSLKYLFQPDREKYKLSYIWAGWALMIAVATMVIKGSFLLVGNLLNWPETVAVVVAAIHDIMALIAIIFGIVAFGLLLLEGRYTAPKTSPKAAKAPA